MSTIRFRLFASDLDGTLLGNPESTRRFREAWEAIPDDRRPALVYATGRLVQDVLKTIPQAGLPRPDYVIGGVGTEIYDMERLTMLREFTELFSEGWDLTAIERIVGAFPGVERQPDEFLHSHKSSWYLYHASPSEIAVIKDRLAGAGLRVTVVYSGLRYLDVLPSQADKGNALGWLCNRLRIRLEEALVAGDSGNDSGMFLLPGIHGIVVENAQPELYEAVVKLPVYTSSMILADGVLDGLRHFGVIENMPPAAPPPPRATWEADPGLQRVLANSRLGELTLEQRELISTGYQKACEAVRLNITPLGFSACSLTHNEVTGTDANYRSVWARDGSMTLIWTLELSDPDVREAGRQTLRTLFDHLSPNGQIPANVRIDDGVPDYSGVGGICSIDSGLWAIIAFYNYVRSTGDLALLDEYASRLERAMGWLSAHDTNQDGLLEVPEAGDWTDLFGLSYHVLYDEVLWCRANVCFGRLLEFQHQFERAAEYLRLSQRIRGTLLNRFWPSTRLTPEAPARTFADQQFSVGDTRYLLAEITPFAFNWRCDVLGNVLAFLCNVLDADRARIAFNFMYGAGVNEPWPVSNLYPPVQSGDPDWKPYYVVNLLNLPHHYHNGGIWPFVGGMWVRFVRRLGLFNLAAHELYRLAELNRAGKTYAWEFNEWAHGRSGRPMGKCYQAWSAASYLRACQELELDGTHGATGTRAPADERSE